MVQKKIKLKYHRFLIQKLVNNFNKKGKKIKSQKFVKNIFLKIKLCFNKNPIILFAIALKKLKPFIETIKVRKSGKNYEVPVPLKKKRQLFIVLKWFISFIKSQKSYNSKEQFNKFSKEICNLVLNKGLLLNHKKSIMKKCFENRAYSHFRWI